MKSSADESSGTGSVAQLVGLRRAIDGLVEAGLSPADADEAVALLAGLECEARRLAALQVSVLVSIEEQRLHQVDGHANVKVMARHVCRLSGATAAGRARCVAVLRELPGVAGRFAAGDIGVDQVQLLGRVYANPRVRSVMVEYDGWLCRLAVTSSFREFEAVVRRWERLVDEDGPEPVNSRNHDQRNARLTQDPFDLSWELIASFAAMQGAAMNEIFGFYIEAELAADWEKAKAEHGDQACFSDLLRTVQQRRADALWQIFQDAASAAPGAVPPGYVHNIVWDAATFERMATRLETADESDRSPGQAASSHDAETSPDVECSLDVETMRCETVDGVELEPIEAIVNATVSAVRRVLVDARGVTIDLGQARLFTGNARHAVRLADSHCVWPGCEVPARACEVDHLREHARGGRTNSGNGAVMCGRHNRWKQKGYTVHRDQTGNWHTHRPDGKAVP